MSYRASIHDALVLAARDEVFPTAVYSQERPSLLTEGPGVGAASIEANELKASFELSRDRGRSVRQERSDWEWLLNIRFNQEVVLEDFENKLLASPLVILRDAAAGRDAQVRLFLDGVSYEHPPRGGASNGTQVSYRFTADLSPF